MKLITTLLSLFLASLCMFATASPEGLSRHNRRASDGNFDGPNPRQHPINRRLTDKLTIRFIQYDPAPAGLTIKDFYYSLLKVQVQIFHIYQSLVPFQPDPVVQTKHGLTFRLHWIEIHMESFGNRLTYATVIDILGGLADMMRDRDLAVLQFTVLETGEQYSEAITNGWIGKDPNYYVGKSNDTTLDSYGAVSRVQPTQNLSTPTS